MITQKFGFGIYPRSFVIEINDLPSDHQWGDDDSGVARASAIPLDNNFAVINIIGYSNSHSEFNQLRIVDLNNKNHQEYEDGAFFVLAGDIGIEYNFDIPLLISLDFRPEIYFGNNYRNDNYGSDIGLSLRYQF
jgi:hypothetical protein